MQILETGQLSALPGWAQIPAAVIGLIGGTAGLLTFIRSIWIERGAYLHLEISCEKEDDSDRIRICTVMENKGKIPKNLDGAFLIVGPELEDPIDTMKLLFPEAPLSTDPVLGLVEHIAGEITAKDEFARNGKQDPSQPPVARLVLPLPYYSKENEDVHDERLTCERTLDVSLLASGIYAARFYLEPGKGRWWERKRLHRVVQTTFEVHAAATTSPSGEREPTPHAAEG